MKLLYTTRSPYARKVQVTALEKGIDLTLVAVDLVNKPEILVQANPLGKIPTLIVDDNTSFCDSTVICEYLDSLVESPALYPKDPSECLKVKNMSGLAQGLMDITVAVFMEQLTHKESASQPFIQNKEAAIKRTLEYFQRRLDQLQEFNLASLSLACAIGYIYFRLDHLAPVNGYGELDAWYRDICQRPSMSITQPKA